jgi:hypothetical protein
MVPIDSGRQASFAAVGFISPRPSSSFMNLSPSSTPRPAGHLLIAAATIGSLSIILVAGLGLLGILDRVNRMLIQIMPHSPSRELPWLAAMIVAFALAFSILGVSGTWRRVVLWITTLVVVAAWTPVLSLAAYVPQTAAPLIAALWSGACAMVYAGNHLMPCDEVRQTQSS